MTGALFNQSDCVNTDPRQISREMSLVVSQFAGTGPAVFQWPPI